MLSSRLACSFLIGLIVAQRYAVGYRQITFRDPARSDRSIPTDIYYPATTAGNNTPIALGQFPVLVFGHGFVMDVSSYRCFADSLVPLGYILLLPRTEGGIPPDHQQFGLDLRFLNEWMKVEGQTLTSPFYQRVASTSAIMGHSMGGGASFLAAQGYTGLTVLVNFAAAITNPSSVQAARQVTVPLLMFLGENDGVTPPATHQIPMFDSCASACKVRVTIRGGGHCYFADPSTTCSFGEGTTSPQPTISRAEQQRRTFGILRPYLNYMLKGSLADSMEFMSRLNDSARVEYVRVCGSTAIRTQAFSCLPCRIDTANPQELHLRCGDAPAERRVVITDLQGRIVYEGWLPEEGLRLSTESWPAGIYVLQLGAHTYRWYKP